MNRILSLVRRCVEDYDMIQPDDRVAVGVSGGKDSLTLLVALAKLREFYPIPFTVEAFTLDMGAAEGRPGMDFSPIAQLCREMEVPYTILLHVCQDAEGGPPQCPAGAGHPQDRTGPPLR